MPQQCSCLAKALTNHVRHLDRAGARRDGQSYRGGKSDTVAGLGRAREHLTPWLVAGLFGHDAAVEPGFVEQPLGFGLRETNE